MDTNVIIQNAIASVLSSIGSSGTTVGIDMIKEWIEKSKKAGSSSLLNELDNADDLAQAVFTQYETNAGLNTYNSETVSRWLEISEADFHNITPENFNSEVMVQHIILEYKFKKWFEEWGYVVELGETLRPTNMPELECAVDVYGKLRTLHGTFEVAVNFVCDNPPDENRVIALASKIGAYADSKESFGQNDVFMIVTPWDFTSIASASIHQQNSKRPYCVLGADGAILHDLETAESEERRLEELQISISQANQEAIVGKNNKT